MNAECLLFPWPRIQYGTLMENEMIQCDCQQEEKHGMAMADEVVWHGHDSIMAGQNGMAMANQMIWALMTW